LRLRFSPRSIAEDHFPENEFRSTSARGKAGTSTASGDSASVQGLSQKSDRTMLKTSAVSWPSSRGRRVCDRGLSAARRKIHPPFAPGHFRVGMSTPAIVCESLPAIAIFPSRAASRAALSLATGHICRSAFLSRNIGFKPMEIFLFPACRHPRKRDGTEEKFALGEVHQSAHESFLAPLNLYVVAFSDAIDAQCASRALGHPNGDLLAQEEVRVVPQGLRAVDGVVVGCRDRTCSCRFQPVIDFGGSL